MSEHLENVAYSLKLFLQGIAVLIGTQCHL